MALWSVTRYSLAVVPTFHYLCHYDGGTSSIANVGNYLPDLRRHVQKDSGVNTAVGHLTSRNAQTLPVCRDNYFFFSGKHIFL
jgi:hypothetical protein